MNKKTYAPDPSIKEYFFIGEGGFFYPVDRPENKKRIGALGGIYPIGCDAKNPSVRFKGNRYQLNRLMYWWHTNEWPEVVAWIDRDTTNYRYENLLVTSYAGARMRDKNGGYSVYPRITKDGKKVYKATIMIAGVNRFIGEYESEQVALFAAWKIRDMLYPSLISTPELIKDFITA
jgi:hypothetical protein